MLEEQLYRYTIEISPTDKITVKNILDLIIQHISPLGEPCVDNETLNEFITNLVIMLDDISRTESLKNYIDEYGHLVLKTQIDFIDKQTS